MERLQITQLNLPEPFKPGVDSFDVSWYKGHSAEEGDEIIEALVPPLAVPFQAANSR